MKNTLKFAFGILCLVVLASCEPKKAASEQETTPAADTTSTEVAAPDTTQVEAPADTTATTPH
jgi:hypothetical protein